MICERCGEPGMTLMTEQYGELCETCQKEVEASEKPAQPRRPSAEDQEWE